VPSFSIQRVFSSTRALCKGPTRCSPAYDLKFSRTISVMTSRCGALQLACSMLASIGAACARCSPVAARKAAEPALHVLDRAICPASLTVLQSCSGLELQVRKI
jgi:hypothetical protein